MRARLSLSIALLLSSITSAHAQGDATERRLGGTKLSAALKDSAAEFWIYDDIQKGYERSRKTGKPLLVSFRCVP